MGDLLLLDRPRREGVQMIETRTKMNPTMNLETKRPGSADQSEHPVKTTPNLKTRYCPNPRRVATTENGSHTVAEILPAVLARIASCRKGGAR